MAPSTSNECAHCGADANQRCSRCSEGVDVDGGPSPTYYCTTDCQKADFSKHKAICRIANARKQLYRAADLLKEVFLELRHAAFDIDIQNVVRSREGRLQIHEREYNGRPLYNFPNALVTGVEDRAALLTFLSCTDAPAHLYELTKKIGKGLTSVAAGPVEAKLHMQSSSKTVVRIRSDGSVDRTIDSHMVLLYCLTGDEVYAVDPTGAQFGQHRAMMPWEKYNDEFVEGPVDFEEPGYCSNYSEEVLEGKHDVRLGPGYDHNTGRIGQELAYTLNSAADEWETSNGKSVAEILNEKQVVFEADKESFVAAVSSDMHDFIEWAKTKLKPRPASPGDSDDVGIAEGVEAMSKLSVAGGEAPHQVVNDTKGRWE